MRIKEIKGYNRMYYISDNGKVFSKYNGEMTEKKPFYSHNGYLRITLWKNGKQKKYFIHRLVAEYFVKNTYNFDSVDHIDENKLNNHYTNLRWTSISYNCARSNAKLNRTQVKYIRENYKRGNGMEIAKLLNIDLSIVVSVAHNRKYNKWIDER